MVGCHVIQKWLPGGTVNIVDRNGARGAMALSPVSLKLTELFRLLQQNYGEGAQINRIDSHGQLDEQDSSQQA